MRTFQIMRYTLLRNLRDYPSMALQVVLPLVVIAILGSTLSAGFEDERSDQKELASIDRTASPTQYPIIHEHRPLRAIDYYAVTVMVMMVMFGVVYGADSVVEQRLGRTAGRLALAGVGRGAGGLGVWIATVLTMVLQGLAIVLVTGLVFRVPWWRELPGVVAMIVIIAFFAGAAGVLVGEIVRSYGAVRVLLQALVFYWTFVAGGFVRFPATSLFSRVLRLSSPAYHANRALLTMLPGMHVPGMHQPGEAGPGALARALPSMGLLLLTSAVLLAVTAVINARRRHR